MSTKIYVAYMFKGKTSEFWPWLRQTRARAVDESKKALRDFYGKLAGSVLTDSEPYKKHIAAGRSDAKARLYMVREVLREGYKEQATSPYRDPFNFDVSLAIRERGRRLYLIPHCDGQMSGVFDFLKGDPLLADFSYWNNTDHPKEITVAEWKRRGRVWDAIDKAGWLNYVAMEVVTWNGFWQIDPFFDMLKELHEKGEKGEKAE